MKKMYTTIIIIIFTVYIITGVRAYLVVWFTPGCKLTSIYPYYFSPITWIINFKPNGHTGDAAVKLAASTCGKYKVNIITGQKQIINK